MTDSFGNTDSAYFVSSKEILDWINTTFKLSLAKIEQAANGAVYCQILDACHPSKIKMNKVNWKAKHDHEILSNYKILQQGFDLCKIKKPIEINKLIKAKYLDNLVFLQWFKKYFETIFYNLEYDPVARRNGNELGVGVDNNNTKSLNTSKSHENLGLKSMKLKQVVNDSKIKPNLQNKGDSAININIIKVSDSSTTNFQDEKQVNEIHLDCNNKTVEKNISKNELILNEDLLECKKELQIWKKEANQLKISLAEIGRERDFYYSKLRDIEYLLRKAINLDKSNKMILDILYSEKELEVIIDEKGCPSLKNLT